jgi:murein DD-endopeptidase MepM/ murein hydrolase activator NlpD
MKKNILIIFYLFLMALILVGCYKPAPEVEPWKLTFNTPTGIPNRNVPQQPTQVVRATKIGIEEGVTPTPNQPKVMPTLRSVELDYIVQPNDSLGMIARTFGVDLNALSEMNQINNPDLLEIGQQLVIPTVDPNLEPVEFKIIPDSELVNSPSGIGFDFSAFLSHYSGYLSTLKYASEVMQQVSEDYSVNPRILLVALEYQTGWIQSANKSLDPATPAPNDAWQTNLYQTAGAIANDLNWGYYRWLENQTGYFILKDGSYLPASETINAGTAAIQSWASNHFSKDEWLLATSDKGVFDLYQKFFGYPFNYSIDPLIPDTLQQPEMILPFEDGIAWSFTGGPHPGWASGTSWAALDFAPPGSPMGCAVSGDWVTAVADGLIVRNEHGGVIQDLDGDGFEQTGWTVLYLHISSWEQVQSGTIVKAGDRIGHTSCEGGISSGSHLHIARKYNGQWMNASGPYPFVMDGYQAESSGNEYDGFLRKNGDSIEAWAYYRPESLVIR